MAVLYIIISYTLLFTGLFKDSMMSDNVRIGLGIIFGGYGIYRVIRAVKKSLKK
jgi:hypothetical protein